MKKPAMNTSAPASRSTEVTLGLDTGIISVRATVSLMESWSSLDESLLLSSNTSIREMPGSSFELYMSQLQSTYTRDCLFQCSKSVNGMTLRRHSLSQSYLSKTLRITPEVPLEFTSGSHDELHN